MGAVLSFLSPTATSKKKVVLITGASAGIGKDAALALIQRGHIVYGAARRIDRMKELVEAGGHAIQMDITDEQQVVAAVHRVLKEQNCIDVLINNSGFSIAGPAEEASIADGRRQFDVNLFGLVRLTQEVLPHMREKNEGTVINISFGGIGFYFPFNAWYIATKHALEGWTDCLRLELVPFNVKVSVVGAGAIRTEFGNVMAKPTVSEAMKKSVYYKYFDTFLHNFNLVMDRYGSKPSVVSNAIIKAVESSNPKRRYVVGLTARPMLFLRNWCGAAIFDAINLRMIKVKMN
jgi:short-subunit dehydrogenase